MGRKIDWDRENKLKRMAKHGYETISPEDKSPTCAIGDRLSEYFRGGGYEGLPATKNSSRVADKGKVLIFISPGNFKQEPIGLAREKIIEGEREKSIRKSKKRKK